MKKVLVVENSPTIISVADSLLRQRGYDVTCLNDAEKALDFIKAERPDLVLTAIGLNGMDGLQLCRSISAEPLTGGIPVILLMGEKDSIYEDKIDLSGARGRINKPFSPKELISIVDKFTGGSKPAAVKIVDPKAASGPKLEPIEKSDEPAASSENIYADRQPDKKFETVFNLNWHDLDDEAINKPSAVEAKDGSSLGIETDQFGLTKIKDEVVPLERKRRDEDYDWFIGEMKREIQGEKADDAPAGHSAATSQPETDEAIAYKNIGPKPASKDDAKYHQFLEQFRKDTKAMTQVSPSGASVNVNWLVDRIADRLAQKIVEKLDKNELREIISSILKDLK